jgi:hypothetical protein
MAAFRMAMVWAAHKDAASSRRSERTRGQDISYAVMAFTDITKGRKVWPLIVYDVGADRQPAGHGRHRRSKEEVSMNPVDAKISSASTLRVTEKQAYQGAFHRNARVAERQGFEPRTTHVEWCQDVLSTWFIKRLTPPSYQPVSACLAWGHNDGTKPSVHAHVRNLSNRARFPTRMSRQSILSGSTPKSSMRYNRTDSIATRPVGMWPRRISRRFAPEPSSM